MNPDLHGQVAWVTGAGRGIGAGIAIRLAALGAEVWLTARSVAELESTAAAIHAAGGCATVDAADVADAAQVAAVATRLRERGRLDILVCSAGIGIYGPLAESDPTALDRMLGVNVRGTLLCCQEALRLMRPAKCGTILGIASVMAVTGYRNQGAYAASKHAMLGMLKVLAKETQPDGLRVAAICPGGVDTEMVRASRPDLDVSVLMTVADVADAVQYQLSLSPRCAVDIMHLRRSGAEPFAI